MSALGRYAGRSLRLVVVPVAAIAGAFAVSAVAINSFGADPLVVFSSIFRDSYFSAYGLSETLVKATPILFCALAVAVPAWVGLMNVGAEGQLLVGGACGSAVALAFPALPSALLLPMMFLAAFAGGAVWGGTAGVLRTRFGTSEIMVTLLGNFLALFLLQFLVYGPLRDTSSRGWPQSAEFGSAAVLPTVGFGRVHAGLIMAIAVALILFAVRMRTYLGLRLRVIQHGKQSAEYIGLPVERYLLWALIVGGGIAALAGAAEASAIQGRLRVELSVGYGYTGILVSWLSRHNPLAIIASAFVIGGLLAGGDTLQITMGLPSATIGITIGLILILLLIGDVIFDRLRI